MNNIKLEENMDGTYDWSFKHGRDLEETTGDEALRDVIHAEILTRPGELVMKSLASSGCHAHNLLHAGDGQGNRALACKYIEETCRHIPGVQDARARVTLHADGETHVNLSIVKDNGETVKV